MKQTKTDPVAVVALLKEVGASPALTMLISGESMLNDGTAIVMFTIFSQMFLRQMGDTEAIEIDVGIAGKAVNQLKHICFMCDTYTSPGSVHLYNRARVSIYTSTIFFVIHPPCCCLQQQPARYVESDE